MYPPFLNTGMNPLSAPGYGAGSMGPMGMPYGVAPQILIAGATPNNAAAGIPRMNPAPGQNAQPQGAGSTFGSLAQLASLLRGQPPGQSPQGQPQNGASAAPPATLNGASMPLLAHLFPSLAPDAVPNTPINNYYYGLTGGQGMPIPQSGAGGFLSGLFGGGGAMTIGPT